MTMRHEHHEALRTHRTLAAIAAALLLVGCGQEADEGLASTEQHARAQTESSPTKVRKPAPTEPAPAPAPQPAAALLFTTASPGATPVPATELEIATTPSVYVVSQWTGVTSALAQRVSIYEPSGILYYSTAIPFAGTDRSDVSVSIQPDGSYRVSFRLEIQGTPIEMYAITGTWRATVSIDGTSTPAASATVALR